MKKFLLGMALAGLMSATAVAAPIAIEVSFGGYGILQSSVGADGDNSLTLTTGQVVPLTFAVDTCFLAQSGLCGASVLASSSTLAAGTTFTFAGGLSYTVSTASLAGVIFNTTGMYSGGGFTPTAGIMNFSMQPPPIGAPPAFSFSASGSTVPEPGTMALMGLGLISLGAAARRRRARS